MIHVSSLAETLWSIGRALRLRERRCSTVAKYLSDITGEEQELERLGARAGELGAGARTGTA